MAEARVEAIGNTPPRQFSLSGLAAKYQKETAEQPHLTVNLKLFDASASRIVIRYISELHAVRNLTQEVY